MCILLTKPNPMQEIAFSLKEGKKKNKIVARGYLKGLLHTYQSRLTQRATTAL